MRRDALPDLQGGCREGAKDPPVSNFSALAVAMLPLAAQQGAGCCWDDTVIGAPLRSEPDEADVHLALHVAPLRRLAQLPHELVEGWGVVRGVLEPASEWKVCRRNVNCARTTPVSARQCQQRKRNFLHMSPRQDAHSR